MTQSKTRGWLHRVATENGWLLLGSGGDHAAAYLRDRMVINVDFSVVGSIIGAARWEVGQLGRAERPEKGKRTRVRQWLTEPVPIVQQSTS